MKNENQNTLTYYEKIFILILLTLVVSCSERKKSTLETSNLKGAIKSIKVSTHDAYEVFGEPKHENSTKAFSFVWKSLYDQDGYLIESNAYDPSGFYGQDSILSKTKFKYDLNGNEIERRTYDNSGKLTAIWEFNYDQKGNLTESSNCEHAKNDTINSGTKMITSSDEKGRVIKSEVQECDGKPVMTYEYKYDENGNQIEEKFTMSNVTPSISSFKYDDNRNLIEETSQSGTFTYKYEFDTIGNWVKQYKYKDGILETVRIQEIEYYH